MQRATAELKPQDVVNHFTARAVRYDRSSRWCTDESLGVLVLDLTRPQTTDHVLDVACGTGLVSRLFKGRTARVVGLDLTPAMVAQAEPYVDEYRLARAEELPFADGTFDIVVSRQGIQFMDDRRAVQEMVRVLRPGGRVCLVQLCAYGAEDKDEFFEILRMRNPARKNFYVPEDIRALLLQGGCREIELNEHFSDELVEVWADNGAIDLELLGAIRHAYEHASPAFHRSHVLRRQNRDFIDRMLFVVALGRR